MTEEERNSESYSGARPKVGWLIAQLQKYSEDAEIVFATSPADEISLFSIYSEIPSAASKQQKHAKYVYLDLEE